MERPQPFFQRRMFERISVNIQARFFYCNIFYSGKIMNLSESGMYLQTKMIIPHKTIFPVIIRTDTMLLNILTSVRRVCSENDFDVGLGLEVVNPSESYIEYMESIRII